MLPTTTLDVDQISDKKKVFFLFYLEAHTVQQVGVSWAQNRGAGFFSLVADNRPIRQQLFFALQWYTKNTCHVHRFTQGRDTWGVHGHFPPPRTPQHSMPRITCHYNDLSTFSLKFHIVGF
jgi:hypothetical protein